MALEEFSDNRKTIVVSFSLPPNIVKKIEDAAESGQYGGISDEHMRQIQHHSIVTIKSSQKAHDFSRGMNGVHLSIQC